MSFKLPLKESVPDGDSIVVFADEFKKYEDDISNILQMEFCPLKVFKNIALEYHYQGHENTFIEITRSIVDAITNQDEILVKNWYERDKDFDSDFIDIHIRLIASLLNDFIDLKKRYLDVQNTDIEAIELKIINEIKTIETNCKDTNYNEYMFILTAFFQFLQRFNQKYESKEVYEKDYAIERIYKRLTSSGNQKEKDYKHNKYLYTVCVYYGITQYSKGEFEKSLSYFKEAIQNFPNCSSSVRVAAGLCLFKLENYEKAKICLEKVIVSDPSNLDALIYLALIENVYAQRDKANSQTHYNNVYEYCVVAANEKSSNLSALNIIANFLFRNYKLINNFDVSNSYCDSSNRKIVITTDKNNLLELNNGYGIRINKIESTSSCIESFSVISNNDMCCVEILLDRDINYNERSVHCVEIKSYSQVLSLANRAITESNVAGVKSDGYYILGRVHYAQNNLAAAAECFNQAIALNENMMLAWFAVGEIRLITGDYSASLEAFKCVLKKFSDDKEAQAYVMLLKGLMNKELAKYESIVEVASSFAFEIDLWLTQGKLRQFDPSEFPIALNCYLNALESMEKKGVSCSPAILSNISVLYHSLGKLKNAFEYSKKALALSIDSSNDSHFKPIFNSAELCDVFYTWSPNPTPSLSLSARLSANANEYIVTINNIDSSMNSDNSHYRVSQFINIGDKILIGDIQHNVTYSEGNIIQTTNPLRMISSNITYDQVLKIKIPLRNFNSSNITFCFNHARLLEDIGHTSAAIELYMNLLKLNSCYAECYIRLSNIAKDKGDIKVAILLLQYSHVFVKNEIDTCLSLGDLYCESKKFHIGQKMYEKFIVPEISDARSNLALGNMYFNNLDGCRGNASDYNRFKKFARDQYIKALGTNQNILYASVGLGVIAAAEDNDYLAAREIFSKSREANMPVNDNICCNLANIHVKNGRFVDAEHVYQATIKSSSKSLGKFDRQLFEYMAYSQYESKRFEDSIRSLQRCIHIDPAYARSWFNIASVREKFAIDKRSKGSSADLKCAIDETKVAQSIFHHLSNIGNDKLYNYNVARKRASHCHSKEVEYSREYNVVVREIKKQEDENKRREIEHEERRRQKEELLRQQKEDLERENELRNERAKEKAKKLDDLKSKWVNEQQAKPTKGKVKDVNNSDDIKGETSDIFGDSDNDNDKDPVVVDDIFGENVDTAGQVNSSSTRLKRTRDGSSNDVDEDNIFVDNENVGHRNNSSNIFDDSDDDNLDAPSKKSQRVIGGDE